MLAKKSWNGAEKCTTKILMMPFQTMQFYIISWDCKMKYIDFLKTFLSRLEFYNNKSITQSRWCSSALQVT